MSSSDFTDALTTGIVLYSSSVPASVAVEKNTERVRFLLDAIAGKDNYKEVFVDLSTVDKEYLHSNSQHPTNKKTLPQVFKDGKYVGDKELIEESNEFGELRQLLGLPEKK